MRLSSVNGHCLNLLREYDTFGTCLSHEHVVHLPKGLIWVKSLVNQRENSCFDLVVVQQVVNKGLHQSELPDDQVKELIGLSLLDRVVFENLIHESLQSLHKE